MIAFLGVFIASMLFAGILHSAQITLENKTVTNQYSSDICNILYVTNFGIEIDKKVEFDDSWCLSPKVEVSDYIYIKRWYELFN